MKSQTMIPLRKILILRKVCALLACVVIAMIGGCGGGGEESAATEEIPAPKYYKLIMSNQSKGTIIDVTIQGMRLPVKYNKMTSGSTQLLFGKNMNPPDTVTVGWTDTRGDRIEVDVKVKLPKRFNGDMKFVIPANGKVELYAGSVPFEK